MHDLSLAALPAICDRIKKVSGVKTQKAVAELLGLSASGLGNYLRASEGRGKSQGHANLPFQGIAAWALSADVSINWVLTGKGEVRVTSTDSQGGEVATPEQLELLDDALEVLQARDVPGNFDRLLADSIKSYKTAMDAHRKTKRPRRKVMIG